MNHANEICVLIDREKQLREELKRIVDIRRDRQSELFSEMDSKNIPLFKFSDTTFYIKNVEQKDRITTNIKKDHIRKFLRKHGLSDNNYMIDGLLNVDQPKNKKTIMRIRRDKK